MQFAEGAFFNMQTFGQSLIQLVLSGEIDRGVAADASSNKTTSSSRSSTP